MNFLESILPRDVIAMILVCGGLWLIATGIDGTIGAILITIVAFYFGAELLPARIRGNGAIVSGC